MNFSELARRRRSVRLYSGSPVPEEDLDRILKAGILAPSSRNIRPVELIAVRDRNTLEALSRCKTAGAAMLAQASCAVVVLGDTLRSDVWIEDTSIVMAYMQLQAVDLGIGSCWVQCRLRSGEDATCEENVRNLLQIPEHYAVEAILSLGIPAQAPEPAEEPVLTEPPVHHEKF